MTTTAATPFDDNNSSHQWQEELPCFEISFCCLFFYLGWTTFSATFDDDNNHIHVQWRQQPQLPLTTTTAATNNKKSSFVSRFSFVVLFLIPALCYFSWQGGWLVFPPSTTATAANVNYNNSNLRWHRRGPFCCGNSFLLQGGWLVLLPLMTTTAANFDNNNCSQLQQQRIVLFCCGNYLLFFTLQDAWLALLPSTTTTAANFKHNNSIHQWQRRVPLCCHNSLFFFPYRVDNLHCRHWQQ